MSIQREMYFDRLNEKTVKGTKKRDEPFTVVAIKNNKVVDQFAGAEHDELSEVIEYMKKNNPGAKISVEKKKGGVVHTENVEEAKSIPLVRTGQGSFTKDTHPKRKDGKVERLYKADSAGEYDKMVSHGAKFGETTGKPRTKEVTMVFKDDKTRKSFEKKVGIKEGRDEEYEKFFKAALKKFGADSPADFKDEKKKKEFFDYVDKNYKAKDEAVSVKDSVDYEEVNGIIEGYLNKDK